MTKIGKFMSIWRLTNMLLNNQWVKEEFKWEIKKYLKTNWKCNIPKFIGCRKVVLKGKFIAINACFKK